MAVDNHKSWLEEIDANQMRRIVDALYKVHHLNAHILDMDTMLRRIMEEGRMLSDSEACSLLLYDENLDELYFYQAFGEQGEEEALKESVRLKPGEGIAGEVAATHESIVVQDASNDPRVFREADQVTHIQTRSLLAVPMIRKGQLVGVIELVNKAPEQTFTEADRHLLEVFSSLAAGVILNARLVEENVRAERLAAVGQTVAGLSHYTKNILAGLQGSVDLIDEGLESENMTLLTKGWGVLKRSAERLANVVEDMLAFSKERPAAKMPCDLRPVIEDIVDSFRLLYAKKDAQLEVDLDALPERVLADSAALHRALLNLANNAGDAIPEDAGKVAISAKVDGSNELIIEVHDNGGGVPESALTRVFDPFFSTKGSGGTGLGLAVTRKIVKEQGGELEVTESPLGGALFRVRIPQEEGR